MAMNRKGTRDSFSIERLFRYAISIGVFCSLIRCVEAADPSVEVFTQDATVPVLLAQEENFFPGLPFRWSLGVSGGFDDNTNTAPNGDASPFTQVNLTLAKDIRTTRTQLSFLGVGNWIHYFDRMGGTPDDYTGRINLNLQHGVSDRLTLGVAIDAAYLTEPQFGSDLSSARRSGNYFSTVDTFSARYAFSPRLSSYTSYQPSLIDYDDEATSAISDRVDHLFGESLRYRWSERTTLTGEYKFELIDYRTAPRDSTTHFALVGFDYQISPRASATLVGGATFRKFKQGNGDLLIDPNAAVALNYVFAPNSILSWTASYSVEEPNFTERVTQTTARLRTGLVVNYHPARHLTLNLLVNYYHDDNSGVFNPTLPGLGVQSFTEEGFEFVAGGRYAVTDRISLEVKFAHTQLDSVAGYSRNVSSGGVRFSF
jgi:opacity protein-like surface antigen